MREEQWIWGKKSPRQDHPVEKRIQINLEASRPHVNVLDENKFLAIASIVLAFVEYNQANMSIECH
jgi:hypothetical protein